MRSIYRCVIGLGVLVALLTCSTVDAQKMTAKEKEGGKDVNSEKMIKAGILTGKISAIYEDKRAIRLAVTVPIQRVNAGAVQSLQQAQVDLASARLRGDREGMINAQRAILSAQAGLISIEHRTEYVELTVHDDVVVRTAQPKPEFDDKGRIKKLTRAELKELKGPDPKLPGYVADFGEVATDQVVQVTLMKKKVAPGTARTAAKAKPKTKGKLRLGGVEEEEAPTKVDLIGDNLPQISMIVILSEGASWNQ